jgi:hypothetical protein
LERNPLREQLQQALWSSYFHRFFGDRTTAIASVFAPLSLDDAMDALRSARAAHATHKDRPTKDLVRRCVSQMLLCGYRPHHRFDAFLKESAGPKRGTAARQRGADGKHGTERERTMDFLVGWGEREFDLPGASQRRIVSIDEELRDASPRQRVISLPTQIVHRGDAYSVEKQGYFRRQLRDVARLVNPVNWVKLGEFFVRTERESPNPGPKSDRSPWHGVLAEDFMVNWNGLNTYVFRQKLKVDYSVLPGLARSDYALMYEQDDQICLNEGFFEARTVPGSQGWVHVTMRKTVRFTSSILNLLAPAFLSMFLDSKAGGFIQLIETDI